MDGQYTVTECDTPMKMLDLEIKYKRPSSCAQSVSGDFEEDIQQTRPVLKLSITGVGLAKFGDL